MRGVSFIKNDSEIFFLFLKTLIDITMYEWYVDDVELNYRPFRSGKYSGIKFCNALDSLSNLSFVRIRRYPIGAFVERIDEYTDYIESDCDLLLLYFDGGFFEIYAKDKNLIRAIFNFCADNGVEDLEYINDDAATRCWMHF